ncbi:hypothetical protein Ppa06_02820 [Planomonospora parontospora subsp. parontospora]|uniref:Knr4/Smi1-like domain-containing protein n=2 Tax=Planomonospora parontospora TaxID=58119 RepID=A0AA37BBU3_9ACTN|nr:SMI1/KNR4 family protein [Planomonospora parontospora]GGK46519.1 hypothetical protein GCM10010126_02830 [Planomonospora parontospora]GII06484.1 hypothetical protein Ppa06_02820 [Planomonospora parontospora subsp. parontospora]
MRHSVTYRWVRLALATAVVVAAVAAAVRLRRRPAPSGAQPAPGEGAVRGMRVPGGREDPPRGSAPDSPPDSAPGSPAWPPVPVLGAPTAADLARLAREPYEPKPLPPPRPPLDEATRRRVVRWGSAVIALCVLVFAAQALETAVFSEEPATEVTAEAVVTMCDPPEAAGGREGMEPGLIDCGKDGLGDGWTGDGAWIAGAGGGTGFTEPAPTPAPASSGGPESTGGTGGTGAAEAEPTGTVPDRDCSPAVRAPVVRAADPRVVRAVNRQWRRIERWLKANAPETHRRLPGPARARTIAVAEAQMGLRFPDDLKASLLRHGGSAGGDPESWGFPFFLHSSMDVRGIRDTWRRLCGIDAEDLTDPRTEWWDGRMIPVGEDGLGNHLVVDSVRRDVGETDHEGDMDFAPGGVPIRSHHALLRMTADALESGGSIGYWRPVASGGTLDWRIEDED